MFWGTLYCYQRIQERVVKGKTLKRYDYVTGTKKINNHVVFLLME